MPATRSIHLLIAAAILFSQIMSGIHMAGHVHVHRVVLAQVTVASPVLAALQEPHPAHPGFDDHAASHRQVLPVKVPDGSGQGHVDQSCAIYHIYAGSQCALASPNMVPGGVVVVSLPQPVLPSALPGQQFEHNGIRGPPALS